MTIATPIDAALGALDPARYAAKRVAVAVPDTTRPVDYAAVVGPLLDRLRAAGPAELTVVVALGLHRPMSPDELAPLSAVCARYGATLAQHDAAQTVALADDVSQGRAGWPALPAAFAPAIADAEAIVGVGVVEPHQYAGYSGGAKTVAIGCAGAETISAMHGLEFLRDVATAVCRVAANPFQDALWALIAPLAPMDALLALPRAGGGVHDAFFGPVRHAFDTAVAQARGRYVQDVDAPVGWMVLRPPASKAQNFYQASRAATYAALVDRPAIRPGGLLIVEAACPEGIGQGAGEHACAEAMARGRERLLAELRGEVAVQTRGGQQRAYVLARALERCDIALVGAPPIAALEPMGIGQFDSADAALAAYAAGPVGMRVDDPFHRLPMVLGI